LNSSNILANRTRRLIDDIKPDVVFVQTTEKWWESAKHLNFIKSQQEMDQANEYLQKTIPNEILSKISLTRLRFYLFNFLFKLFTGIQVGKNPFLPGLEIKYAIEEAEKLNSKVVFLGNEIDQQTQARLAHETRFTLFKFIRRFLGLNNYWKNEILDNKIMIAEYGFDKFVESCCDSRQIAWFIAFTDKLFQEYKRIFVDKKDVEIFEKIIKNKGKRMVVVVNQHHMEGLSHHWCSAFGQQPTFNTYFTEPINPIGDMKLRKMLYDKMYHVISRDIKSSRMRSPPASFTNDINVYHREFNHQYEHRNM
jgi:pheromone shutdown protein TraB